MNKRILIIRRDNIGDLVCTTPLIHALRIALPDAHIAAYVNSYNVAVLQGNPDLNAVYAYTKGKHIASGESVISAYWQRIKLLWLLRAQRFDDVIIAESAYQIKLARLARWLSRGRVIGFANADGTSPHLDVAIGLNDKPQHEVETVFRLSAAYGMTGTPPLARVFSVSTPIKHDQPIVGLHISARKPSQRWAQANFIALAKLLHARHNVNLMLFWSPGDENNQLHPGDDQKALRIAEALTALPLLARPTQTLPSLIDGLAECDVLICADGGAMHLAAGLGKPIVCLFGKSDTTRWHPWGVPYQLLQTDSLDVNDIRVEAVADAYGALSLRN